MPEYPILVCHSDYGDPECCGIVMPVERAEATAEVEETLLRMAMEGGRHCGLGVLVQRPVQEPRIANDIAP